jgi:hypothetical protein
MAAGSADFVPISDTGIAGAWRNLLRKTHKFRGFLIIGPYPSGQGLSEFFAVIFPECRGRRQHRHRQGDILFSVLCSSQLEMEVAIGGPIAWVPKGRNGLAGGMIR